MYLSEEQIDALQEIFNIGVGRAASSLNELVESSISLQIPFVKLFSFEDLQQELAQNLIGDCFSAVRQNFDGSFSGTAELIFPTESASNLVSLLTGEETDSPDLDAVKIGTLSELGNIVINGVLGSMANIFQQYMTYTIPVYIEDTIKNLLDLDKRDDNTFFLLAQASFKIEHLEIVGDIILILEMNSLDVLLTAINQELGVAL